MFSTLTAIPRFLFTSKQSKHSNSLPKSSVFAVAKLVAHCLFNLKDQAFGHATWQKLQFGRMLQMWVLKKQDGSIKLHLEIFNTHKCPSPVHQIRPLVGLMNEVLNRKIYGISVSYNHKSVYNYLIGFRKAQLPEIKAGMQYIFSVILTNKIAMVREKKKRIEQMELCLPPCQFNKIQETAKECEKNKEDAQNGMNLSRKDFCEL